MSYQLSITEVAESHWKTLSAREQRIIEAAMLSRLLEFPTQPTRAIKRLRPNPLAEYELRVGNFRVLYNVEETEVIILAIGCKVGNKLIVAGEEFHEHQPNPPESSGDGPAGGT